MKFYNYLLSKMIKHSHKIAFGNHKITYKELIQQIQVQAKKYSTKDQLIPSLQKSREMQAIEILAILASHNVAVPLCNDYGVNQKDYILKLIKSKPMQEDDLALLMFTSGTTSASKGVMLSDENLIYSLKGIEQYFQLLSNDESIIICRPLVHIASLVGELFFGLMKGLTIYFYEDLFFPLKLNQFIQKNNITILGATPSIFHRLMIAKASLSTLKYAIISGEILSPDLAIQIANTYKDIRFYHVYGMTENCSRIAYLPCEDFIKYPGSVGKPILNTQIKIENGEILIQGKSLMKGYFNNVELTKRKIRNGYFHTGDLGYFNEKGYLYILGRKDNMIIKYGINIYPEEIENIVKNYPNVKECLVYKIKGQTEKIGLKVVGKINRNQFISYLCHHLSNVYMPDKIDIVNHLEMTPSGKIKR